MSSVPDMGPVPSRDTVSATTADRAAPGRVRVDRGATDGVPRRSVRARLAERLDGRRLFRTSAFRIALIYATLFSALSAATLGFIYWSTREQIMSQIDVRLRLETKYLASIYESGALDTLLEVIQRRNQDETSDRFYDLTSTGTQGTLAEQESTKPLRLKSVSSQTTTTMGDVADLAPGDPRRFDPVRVSQTQLSSGLKLTIGYDISDEQALLAHTFVLVVGATLLTLLFSLIGGLLIGLSVLRRIDSVSRTASEIMSGDLSQRLSVTARDDEFDEIATKLNQMLDRIEDLMKSIQQVTNNVAHDLRSPLTRIRNRLEVTLLEERDPENYRVVMGEVIGDADSLIHTFNAMLGIARLEAGIDAVEWSDARIGDVMGELAELYEAVAEEEDGLDFVVRIDGDPFYRCNPHLIAQAVTNLLDNAIKYTPRPGRVALVVEGDDERFSISVTDTGPGIPEHERERVFKRFVRLENERNSPGNGLGLSLVKAVSRLHHATLELADAEPGLRVVMHFSKQRSVEREKRRQRRLEARAVSRAERDAAA